MRWSIIAAAVVAVATWATAITLGIAEHSERSTELLTIYLVNGAMLATLVAVALWLTDLLRGELLDLRTEQQDVRAIADRILNELHSEHDQADQALRALLQRDDDSDSRIRRIRT